MTAIASGKAVDKISAQLLLSPETISTFNISILEKLELKDNSELLNYCFEEGLI
jgi:DNA-binding NarL/FixJ family response regulator